MQTNEILDTSRSVVLDTCVFADALFSNRERHDQAVELCTALKERGQNALVPAHAYFELVSVVFSDRHRRGQPLSLGEFGKELPIEVQIVDINLHFIETHLFPALAAGEALNSSGGDMVYLALSLGQSCPLITADAKLRVKAKQLGISVFSAEEYLNS